MKQFFIKHKITILTALIVITLWLLAATFVYRPVLDVLAYWALGYYWLGEVVSPWVRKKLEKVLA